MHHSPEVSFSSISFGKETSRIQHPTVDDLQRVRARFLPTLLDFDDCNTSHCAVSAKLSCSCCALVATCTNRPLLCRSVWLQRSLVSRCRVRDVWFSHFCSVGILVRCTLPSAYTHDTRARAHTGRTHARYTTRHDTTRHTTNTHTIHTHETPDTIPFPNLSRALMFLAEQADELQADPEPGRGPAAQAHDIFVNFCGSARPSNGRGAMRCSWSMSWKPSPMAPCRVCKVDFEIHAPSDSTSGGQPQEWPLWNAWRTYLTEGLKCTSQWC